MGVLRLLEWKNNLSLNNGRAIKIKEPDLIIASDAATSAGWGAHCQGITTRGGWTLSEKNEDINILEIRAATMAFEPSRKKYRTAPYSYKQTTWQPSTTSGRWGAPKPLLCRN